MGNKVLITGARSAVAIDMARDFHDFGYEVYMADCSSAYISRWSNIPRRVYKYASPVECREQFISDIRRIAGSVNPDMIVPTCEEVYHLAHAFAGTDMQNKVFAPSVPDLDTLHNKYTFAKLCENLGLNVPETHKLDRLQDLEHFRSSPEKWVFKPCYSRFGAETMIAPSLDKLNSLSFDKKTSWVAQRFVRGKELSFYAISRSGKLRALAVYSSSWRLGGGASYVFEPVSAELFNDVKNIAERIAVKLNLSCQFSCDLMQDDTGKPWLIECNPRSTSGQHLLRGQLAKALAGSDPSFVSAQPVTKYMLPMMLSYGLINAVKSRRIASWFEAIKAGKDVIGGKNDRLPVCGALVDTAIFMRHGMRKNISLSQATTADIEWNGEAFP